MDVRTRNLALSFATAFSVAAAPRLVAQQATVYSDAAFELGDGIDPIAPGLADILGSSQPGPDWEDLFNADGSPRDILDEFGNPGGNGVPDFLDEWGGVRSDVMFVADEVSAGTGNDPSAWTSPGIVGDGLVEPANDIGNAYGYSAFNSDGEPVLYLGVERTTTGSGTWIFELSRNPVAVGSDGQLQGTRTLGDLQIQALFDGELLSGLQVSQWQVLEPVSGEEGWLVREALTAAAPNPAEQCNPAGTLCALSNGSPVVGGPWPHYDAIEGAVQDLSTNTFLEIGLNLQRVLGTHSYQNYYETRYTSVQISTSQDYALGHFLRASRLAGFAAP